MLNMLAGLSIPSEYRKHIWIAAFPPVLRWRIPLILYPRRALSFHQTSVAYIMHIFYAQLAQNPIFD